MQDDFNESEVHSEGFQTCRHLTEKMLEDYLTKNPKSKIHIEKLLKALKDGEFNYGCWEFN